MWRSIELGLLMAGFACAQIPRNLDFREGEAGKPPFAWSADNASVETRHDGCAPSAACAVITGGEIRQKLDALYYRGKPVRLRAWLRDGAQLWLRVNGPQPSSFFDNLAAKPVRGGEWKPSEISLIVPGNAESIEFGVSALGTNPAWVREVSLDLVNGFSFVPRNLDFGDGETDQQAPGWAVYPERTDYKAAVSHEGCQIGPSCAILFAPAQTPAGSFGALVQTVDAVQYRGKTVRLRAWVKLASAAEGNLARLFIQDRNNMFGREIRDTDWTEYEAIRSIDAASSTISFGVGLNGSGSVRVDGMALDVIPEGQPLSTAVPSATKAALPVSASSAARAASPQDSGQPSIDETRQIINTAARIALAWNSSLPDFICTQTIRRSENTGNKGWKVNDVLTVQLGSAAGKEYHKLLAIDDKPAKVGYDSVIGATSEGEFGGVLSQVFRPGAASFWWDEDTTLRSHPVHVYRYEVEVAKSDFKLFFSATSWSAIVGHHGLVYLDRDTGQVLRMIQIAYVPKNAPLLGSMATMDYDYTDVAGKQYLLPLKAEVLLTTAAQQFRNEIAFHDYRKFTADSSLLFDEPVR